MCREGLQIMASVARLDKLNLDIIARPWTNLEGVSIEWRIIEECLDTQLHRLNSLQIAGARQRVGNKIYIYGNDIRRIGAKMEVARLIAHRRLIDKRANGRNIYPILYQLNMPSLAVDINHNDHIKLPKLLTRGANKYLKRCHNNNYFFGRNTLFCTKLCHKNSNNLHNLVFYRKFAD